jgi:septal ring factor EnvC (AmiA/AmiB activator)
MDWLKELIEKHTKDGVLNQEALIKDVNKEFPKYAVPKDKYNEVSEAKKQLETDIVERDKQLKDLGDKAKDNEDLENQIKELQETNKKLKQNMKQRLRMLL